tara:strand:+ start:200 stop:481 length:282 start_codon:yes stop_codon:yes gene_type:complete
MYHSIKCLPDHSSGLKATPETVQGGNEEGSAYLVPKPLSQGYAVIRGEVALFPTTMLASSGLKAHVKAKLGGSVDGSEYFVPKPEEDHGYTEI